MSRFIIPALFLTCLLTACGGPSQSDLIGTWKVDTEALEAQMEAQAENDEQTAAVGQMVMGMMAQMRFTFDEEKVTFSGMGQDKNSQYEVLSQEGQTLKLQISDEDGTEHQGTARFEGETLFLGNPAQEGPVEEFPLVRAEDGDGE